MDEGNINLKKIEKKWKNFWEKNKTFRFDIKSKKPIYSIDTPPPTVSGKMHIGHAFSYSQQDFIVRFRRMFHGSVFYPFGTDDNGLPTERLVEKIKNVKSKEMSRADFIELCLKTLKEITPDFIRDWKDLGISCDYDISYSTIDKQTQKISQKSFIELFKKGFIYKKEFPTLWCPECQTAIAQAELEDKQKETLFSTLKFKINNEDFLIATTRPELLGACVDVFINPKDKRYKNFAGKKAKVPMFNFEVPIIEDESADIEKGSGVLMVCSYGDKFDVDAIQRHKLFPKHILTKDGRLSIKEYQGLKIKDAKKKILDDLRSQNLIKEQKNIIHNLNVHDKCGTPIEFLATEQWFIKILNLKKDLISQGEKIKWHPQHMFKRYENWVNGLDWDWNISRDRHFGIPIPVWECKKCKNFILPIEKELPIDPLQKSKICPKCKEKAIPETKVLDTWATSSLTPQIASSLINSKLKIPYSLRPQAHDIIRTWAFYTIVKSYLHEKKIPWKDIVISGNVSLKGEKMSKSKGNVIEPKLVMNQYGADALRYWAAGSKLGEDLDYQEKDLVTAKKFITKISNSARFVFMNLKNYKPKTLNKLELTETDRLFLLELNELIKKCTKSFEEYEYSKSKLESDSFFWRVFCDNYLEIIKNRVYNGTEKEKESAFYTLYTSLLTFLKLFAPITPFITEEIYQNYYKKNEGDSSVHLSNWPKELRIKRGKKDKEIFELMLNMIYKVRQEKSNAKKSMKSEITLTIEKKDIEKLKDVLQDLKSVTNASEIKEGRFNVEFKE